MPTITGGWATKEAWPATQYSIIITTIIIMIFIISCMFLTSVDDHYQRLHRWSGLNLLEEAWPAPQYSIYIQSTTPTHHPTLCRTRNAEPCTKTECERISYCSSTHRTSSIPRPPPPPLDSPSIPFHLQLKGTEGNQCHQRRRELDPHHHDPDDGDYDDDLLDENDDETVSAGSNQCHCGRPQAVIETSLIRRDQTVTSLWLFVCWCFCLLFFLFRRDQTVTSLRLFVWKCFCLLNVFFLFGEIRSWHSSDCLLVCWLLGLPLCFTALQGFELLICWCPFISCLLFWFVCCSW